MLPQAPTVSATRAPPEHVKPPADAAPAGSAITVVPRRENRWQKQWQDMRSQARLPSPSGHGAPCAERHQPVSAPRIQRMRYQLSHNTFALAHCRALCALFAQHVPQQACFLRAHCTRSPGTAVNVEARPPDGVPHGVQLGQHPLFQRLASLGEHRVFAKGKEVADDLRERWETSDSPLVQRIQARAQLSATRLLALAVRASRASVGIRAQS